MLDLILESRKDNRSVGWYSFSDFDTTGQLILVEGTLALKLGDTLYPMTSTTRIEEQDTP